MLIYTRTSPTHYSLESGGQATYIKCHPKKKHVKLRFVHYIIFNTDTKLRWDYKYWIRLCGWTFGPSEWIRSIRILGTKNCNIVSRIWPPRSTTSSCLLLFFFSFLFFWDRKPKKKPHFEGRRIPSGTPYLLGNTELCHLVSSTYREGNSKHMSLIVSHGLFILVWCFKSMLRF